MLFRTRGRHAPPARDVSAHETLESAAFGRGGRRAIFENVKSTGAPGMEDSESGIEDVAASLYAAHRDARPVAPIAARLPAQTLDAAYEVQRLNLRRWARDGRRPVGRKVGLTSPSVQRQLGVDRPDFGTLFADTAYGNGEAVPLDALIQPKLEAEVALVLARELPFVDATRADLLRAIDFLLPAIEIVDSRIADWRIGLLDTVADNASSGLFVLGDRPVRPGEVEVSAVKMETRVNGEIVSTGSGGDCLGSPLNAALWLARELARRGEPLAPGDIVLTGALGPMAAAAPESRVEVSIEGVGGIAVDLTTVMEAREPGSAPRSTDSAPRRLARGKLTAETDT